MTSLSLKLYAAPASQATEPPRLRGERLRLGYRQRTICEQLDVNIPNGSFSVIIGPNGCGKSTLLRSLSRLLKPQAGQVCLDGRDIHGYPAKTVAQQLGLLPQSAVAPDGITVTDLVARGRYPHQSLLRQWSRQDEEAVRQALAATGTDALADRLVDELSGGQRQRVWWRWRWRSKRRCCCWTSRPLIWTSRIRSSCWSCSAA